MWLPSTVERAREQFRRDLAVDPYLKYILGLSFLLSTFWLWHRLPNFATRDERWRVVDSMEVAGFVVNDGFSLDSLQQGTAYWRPFGPTLYLYGLVTLPAIGAAVLLGEASVFGDIFGAWGVDYYAHWQSIPAWLWWATVLPARFVNALLTVGCVYLLYRIGTRVRDRATGRLAALLLALTWGVIVLAHEAGEDVPALFCILLVFYLAVRYVDSGSKMAFLGGSAIGGLAIAFKPTAGITAVIVGTAYLLRVVRARDKKAALFRPTLLVGGPVIALVVLYLGFPSAVLNGPEILQDRIDRVANEKTTTHGFLSRPTWWWFVRSTVNGLGWPLTLAALGGIGAGVAHLLRRTKEELAITVARLRGQSLSDGGRPRDDRSLETVGVALALSGIAAMASVFSTWAYFRTHHLLPIFPLAILLFAVAFRWLETDRDSLSFGRLSVEHGRVARALVAVLIVTTALYAGIGTLGYATHSRDKAVSYLETQGGANATVETYSRDVQQAAVPHGWTIYRPSAGTGQQSRAEWMQNIEQRCPDYVVLNYQRAMLWLAPDNHSQIASWATRPGESEYIGDLLVEDGPYKTDNAPYPYDIAEEFGRRPPFVDDMEPFDRTWNMVRAGIFPRTIQYGDPQEFGVFDYAIVLERAGSCEGA